MVDLSLKKGCLTEKLLEKNNMVHIYDWDEWNNMVIV